VKGSALYVVVLPFALTGCWSRTPDCGDGATLDLLDQAVFERVEKYAEASGRANSDEFSAIADTYSISNIRTLSYDDRIDSYRCDARITYEFRGKERSVDFGYRVDTEQGSGEAMIEYQNKMLNPIAGFAAGF